MFKCQLQIDHLEKMIFVNKNWPHDPCIGCSKLSNFTSACEAKFDLLEEFDIDQFENEFE